MTWNEGIPALADYHLEESDLLGVVERPREVDLETNFMLLSTHPQIRPSSVERGPYMRTGLIRFRDVTRFEWKTALGPWTDSSGTKYWPGMFAKFDGEKYLLSGHFGEMTIVAGRVDTLLTGPG